MSDHRTTAAAHRARIEPRKPGSVIWRAVCSCGYRSAKRRSPELATEAAVHHVRTVRTAARAAGRPP